MISECSKLAQTDYKTRHKVIHWELCKKFRSDHTNKWYMHNPESVQENETHKILRDFAIQTSHLILARRPDLVIIKKKKKNLLNSGLCCSGWSQGKSEMRDIYLDLAREEKKTMEHESYGGTNCNWRTRYSHQRIGRETEGLENKRTSGDHLFYSIVEIGQNTKKSPRDWKRLAVTRTPAENHQQTLGLKTLKA